MDMNDQSTLQALSDDLLEAVIGGAYDPANVIYMPRPAPYPYPYPGDGSGGGGGGGGRYELLDVP